ncbi:MAG: hypothetical protein AAB890_02650 [Patescibacteria group bacterium]
MKYFVYFIIAIVAMAAIFGFFIVGSPAEERLRRFDERRVQDLQIIQSEIVNYWANKDRLPRQLADLQDNIRGFITPKDPENSNDYGYEVRGNLDFILCANFNTSNFQESANTPKPVSDPYYQQSNWQHNSGNVCFDRNIDPQIYGPKIRPPEKN